MLKEKKINKWILVIVAVVVVLLMVGGGILMFRNYVSIHGKHLNKYSYSSGGGMTGGYHRETVKRQEDYAIITIESAEWYSQDPTVTEYLADVAVLDELETVVRENKMNFWNRKKFTNMFVHDGESTSYDFDFDEANISFSSQIYPIEYGNKLSKLDDVVKKYIGSAEKLPGLVNPRAGEEDNYSIPENELVIYVNSYAKNTLGIKILNGTDEDTEFSETYKIVNADTDTLMLEGNTPYNNKISGHSMDVIDIKLKERLQAGNYKIVFADLEILFEIK